MAVGTALGGWRIVKTMGSRLPSFSPVGGCCARDGRCGNAVHGHLPGIPVSTTQPHHRRGIIGVGATRRLTGIKWDIAIRIVMAWVVTIPCSAHHSRRADFLCHRRHAGEACLYRNNWTHPMNRSTLSAP